MALSLPGLITEEIVLQEGSPFSIVSFAVPGSALLCSALVVLCSHHGRGCRHFSQAVSVNRLLPAVPGKLIRAVVSHRGAHAALVPLWYWRCVGSVARGGGGGCASAWLGPGYRGGPVRWPRADQACGLVSQRQTVVLITV